MNCSEYPNIDAINSVLKKLSIEPSDRYDAYDQDYEYTTCRLEELENYVNLYNENDTTICEKRVLGCYFLECLNEYVQAYDRVHPVQGKVLQLLFMDIIIHDKELKVWSNTAEQDESLWWPITKYLIEYKGT